MLTRINFIVGEPGVGKTDFVRCTQRAGDLILDPVVEQHPTRMESFIRRLHATERRVFLVTHSQELIRKAYEVLPPGDMVVIRLEVHTHGKPIFVLDHESLGACFHYGSAIL